MPRNLKSAINFLETQWSSINKNKLEGITAKLRFESYLNLPANRKLYEFIIPGGWILTPAKNTLVDPVTKGRIAIIPVPTSFSWSANLPPIQFAATVYATSYFRQTGITTYFARFDTTGTSTIEEDFELPWRRPYHTSYDLKFYKIGGNNLTDVNVEIVMANFNREKA